MSCSFGERVRLTIFGQSHSEMLGCVLDGLPAGEPVDLQQLAAFMRRRAPGRNAFSTPRKEADTVRFVSGLVNDTTVGAPVCALIENTNTKSQDYDKLRQFPRPGHADYTAFVKHGGANDARGGGNFSGRMTAALCAGGGLLMQMLSRRGIEIGAHIAAIHTAEDAPVSPVTGDMARLKAAEDKPFPVLDDAKGERMQAVVLEAKQAGDSVGGVIECAITGVPVGAGEPMFDGIENKIAAAMFAIPAVKGIEFGAGFASARLYGSENNDCFYRDGDAVRTQTNNHGGCLGGLASGMPIIFRVAIKPTPSITQPQQTLDLQTGQQETLVIGGRHDPCIVPRAVPVVQAAAALAMADFILK